ncbi:ATP-binding cassette domain-containing protein [Desulfosporosinus fructosivorans]|uniref:ATP-binding cassette domain-containing protein n=1 Tax=Desulfosporosinus fructosivorans TaxID=2018669 RepID=A0A4Z0R2W1_9FIRM|nr:ATP-binding cassette domain-containing protein [Desulfosporosinus fructosivorans]TGE37108.1 ATP-binding cassette domain-containing protein [Desulfosporosinus fructosivorans]
MIQTNTAISVSGIEKSFKNIKVLQNVNFTVRKGSIFALLGSNGAGKTTMIKILSTLIKPDQGSAQVCGFDVTRQPNQVREEISLTGQNAAVDGVLTGRENLRMLGKLRHLPDSNQQADVLLERFDLLEAADRRVATYSGGMRRRLDLSMSLLGTPSVVFLDEPTTGLDPQSRITMWKIITDLAHSGITVFLTTQYLDEADQLADQIAILNNGKIVAEGTAAELKKLLPHGHIELSFRNEKEVQTARDLLGDYKVSLDGENQALIVTTDGSIKQMTDILNRLQNAGLSVAEFAQKLPTLEDVFLTIIGEKQGKEMSNDDLIRN